MENKIINFLQNGLTDFDDHCVPFQDWWNSLDECDQTDICLRFSNFCLTNFVTNDEVDDMKYTIADKLRNVARDIEEEDYY